MQYVYRNDEKRDRHVQVVNRANRTKGASYRLKKKGWILGVAVAAAALAYPIAGAQEPLGVPGFRDESGRAINPNDVAITRQEAQRSQRPMDEGEKKKPDQPSQTRPGLFGLLKEFRSIDGSGNNADHPDWGKAGTPLVRLSDPAYEDGAGAPSGYDRPSPRLVSNLVAAQVDTRPSARRTSDYIWQWGQFIDHDLDLVPTLSPAEQFDIAVPLGDPFFDPSSTGTQTIPLNRSFYVVEGGARQQMNSLTAYIDGSMIYGSDEARAKALRTLDGTGRLRQSQGGFLPWSLSGDPNVPDTNPPSFAAGDVRVNEQAGLTVMHTLWVREHNYWADAVRRSNRQLSDEEIYQRARAMVAAEVQFITYNEFLPVLLGRNALGPYTGYQPNINASVSNEFATAAYRVGHTMLSPQLARLNARLRPISAGPLPLRDAFFNLDAVTSVGIDPYLRGLARQVAQEIDCFVIDDVRNFLFGPPGAGGFDLPALNMQRGRDHGIADFNSVRVAIGLPAVTNFAEIASDPGVQQFLADAYGSVDDVDLWMAGITEDHVPGAIVGETFWTILTEQFLAARDGDRFWYQNYLPPAMQRKVERETLASVIRRNTRIGYELQNRVFIVPRK